MKIAIIGQKGIPAQFGGIERHVEELSLELVKRGHQVTVYTRPYYTKANRKTYKGIRLISINSLRTKHLDAITHTLFSSIHAATKGYDIIHYHGVGPSLLSFIPRIFSRKAKVVSTFHCVDRRHQKWNGFARYMLWLGEWASLVFPHQTIAVSKSIQKYCVKSFNKKPIYIPNGISKDFLKQSKAKLIKNKFGLITDQYILAVSRLIPHKGIHYLIEAYKRINTNKRLVIAGGSFFTDAYVKRLKEIAGNDPRIIFTGFQKGKTLSELYSNAYLFVLPSESEGLPIALLEAAGYGQCALASNIPENMEVIRANKENIGYTFKNKDVNDLQKKLAELLQKPVQTKKIGKSARQTVLKEFNWHKIANQTEQLYATR